MQPSEQHSIATTITTTPQQDVAVDFSLLVPVLYLTEALLQDYRHKKVIVKLLNFVITKKNTRIGKTGILSWLNKEEFCHTEELERILRYTPIGNPAWQLFSSSPHENLKKDIESFISQTSPSNPRSLKSLIKDFITAHPQYGAVGDSFNKEEWTTFSTAAREWPLGDVVTRLMLLQTAATPCAQKKKDKFPIHRPSPVLYGVALQDLLIGAATVSRDAWDEMITLYMSKHFTNFLAFAPLLIQPFIKSDLNIPAPTLNTLATLMGDFTGATGTFMGDVTRSGVTVRWEKLGITIGKLCEKTRKLDTVTENTPNQEAELSLALNNRTKICGDDLTETPTIGEDRGWILIGEELLEDRWNINLTDINNSIKNDKIKFNKFPSGFKGTQVFKTSWALKCLNQWRRKQVKQSVVVRLLGDLGTWFNKLPPTHLLADNVFTAFPLLTYTFRSEKTALFRKRKFTVNASGLVAPATASKDEAKTDKFLSSTTETSLMNVTETNKISMRLAVGRPLLKERNGASSFPDDDGISNFFIAETYQGEQYRKTSISKLRIQLASKLAEERKEQEAYQRLFRMTKDELYEEITSHMTSVSCGNTTCKEDLDNAISELCRRDLNLQINTINTKEEPRFRYRLGDEEAVAVEVWFKEEPEDDNKPAIKTTKAFQRIKVALTFIYLLRYFKSIGEEWSFKRMWDYGVFKKYPLAVSDLRAVFSLVPYLYWVYFLKQPDMFRIKRPDTSTVLFVPTARISDNTDGDFLEEIEEKKLVKMESPSDVYLPDVLDGVRVSRLSLCSLNEWKPRMILESASKYFCLDYHPSLHPNKTQYLRLYVKLGVERVLHRLSNANMAETLSSASSIPSQMLPSIVKDILDKLKERLKEWYCEFINEFNNTWRMLGDEWVQFLDVSEQKIDVHYV